MQSQGSGRSRWTDTASQISNIFHSAWPVYPKSTWGLPVETPEGLHGVAIYMDDGHEGAWWAAAESHGVLRQVELHFLGQVINKEGVRPDPVNVSAINEINPPENVQELNRTFGMINHQGKYDHKATVGQPLYELLISKSEWIWGPAQQKAFIQIKELLTIP